VRFRGAESGPERAFNHDVIIILRGERRSRWRHGHQLAMAILRLMWRLIYTVFMSPYRTVITRGGYGRNIAAPSEIRGTRFKQREDAWVHSEYEEPGGISADERRR